MCLAVHQRVYISGLRLDPECGCAGCYTYYKILSDSNCNKASAIWAAMRECVTILQRIDGSSTLCECGLVGDSCVAHTHLNAAHAALCRLAEVQKGDADA